MNTWIIKILNRFGYFGILFLIAIENIFPPIPSEIILTFSGFMTNKSELTIIGVIFYSVVGSLIGALILYYIGYKINIEKLKKIIKSNIGKSLFIKENDIDKANKWFNSKGNKTVFICRFIPILRSLISIPAGMNKMNITKFLIYTFLGSLIWNAVLIAFGSIVGENYNVIESIIKTYSSFVLILFVFFIMIIIIKNIKKKS